MSISGKQDSSSLGWISSVRADHLGETYLIRQERILLISRGSETRFMIFFFFFVTICFQSFYLQPFESLSKALLNKPLFGFGRGMLKRCAFLSVNEELVQVVTGGIAFLEAMICACAKALELQGNINL